MPEQEKKELFIIKSGNVKHLIEASTIKDAHAFAKFLFENASFITRSPYWWELGTEVWWRV